MRLSAAGASVSVTQCTCKLSISCMLRGRLQGAEESALHPATPPKWNSAGCTALLSPFGSTMQHLANPQNLHLVLHMGSCIHRSCTCEWVIAACWYVPLWSLSGSITLDRRKQLICTEAQIRLSAQHAKVYHSMRPPGVYDAMLLDTGQANSFILS